MGRIAFTGFALAGVAGLALAGEVGFDPPQPFDTGLVGPGSGTPLMFTADVDGDGRLDVISIGEWSDRIFVMRNQGAGTFSQATRVDVPAQNNSGRVLDVEGDGDPDIVLAMLGNPQFGVIDYDDPGSRDVVTQDGVVVLLNEGAGGFTPTTYTIFGGYGPADVLDVDRDGELDLVIGGAFGPSILFGDGNGGFGNPAFLTTEIVSSHIKDLRVADMDGDANLDVVVSTMTGIVVLRNVGPGSFSILPQADRPASSDWLERMVVGDFDGDGDTDVVAKCVQTNVLSESFFIWDNEGGGVLAPYRAIPAATSNARQIHAVDVSGDGRPDLVTSGTIRTHIYENRGNGTFLAPLAYEFGGRPGTIQHGAALGDLLGDGAQDLATFEDVEHVFAVRPGSSLPAPAPASLSPATANLGTTVQFTITGTGFVDGAAVDFGSVGALDQLTFVAPSSLTATVMFPQDAPQDFVPGPRTVTVTNPDGKSGEATFDLQFGPLPAVDAIAPAFARQGETVAVTITGSDYDDAVSVDFGTDVVVNTLQRVGAGELTVDITVGGSAAVGLREVTVTNGTGRATTVGDLFEILPPLTVDLAIRKGVLKDSTKPGRDKVSAQGDFTFNAFSPDGVFTSATDAVAVRIGDPADPLEFAIPAGESGWRVRNGRHTWRSPRGVLPRIAMQIDTDRGTFKIVVSRADFATALQGEVLVDIVAGDDHGSETRAWTAKRGKLKL